MSSLPHRLSASLSAWIQDEDGQTTVEYAMVISVLAIALLSSFYVFTGGFARAMEALSGNLKTSLTDDGIRP